MSTQGNTTEEVLGTMAEAAAKKLVYEVLFTAVMKRIVAAVPFFGLSFINPIVGFIVTKVLDAAYEEGKIIGMFAWIDIKTEVAQQEYDEAVSGLKETLKSPQASPEEIKKAQDEFKKKLSKLVKVNSPK